MKITKVEWYASDYVKSLRFTMFDGTFSPVLGSRPPSQQQEFGSGTVLGSIHVGVTHDNYIASLVFLDDSKKKILVIKGTKESS